MAKKPDFHLTDKHHTSLGDIVDQASTMVVFGKPLNDLQPTSQGHRFAQIFGYKRNGVCSKLPASVVIALPDPDGPADDCGWAPEEFVKWQLPLSFASTQLHVQPVALDDALATFTASGLNGDQLFAIISSSIQAVTGSNLPLTPSVTLQSFGLLSPEQLAQFSAVIASKVSQDGFTLDNNALAPIGSTSTIAQLQSAIFSGAKPNA
jgi:hypothetical protein